MSIAYIFTFVLSSLILVMGVLLGIKLTKRISRGKRKKRQQRAQRGEAEAPAVLLKHGYKIVETQARRLSSIVVNGESKSFGVRADLIVEDKAGRRFVADVKTGKEAPNPMHAATRRQLLEYRLIYENIENILLIDMERREVICVEFPKHMEGAK